VTDLKNQDKAQPNT